MMIAEIVVIDPSALGICDKCGGKVPHDNDAARFDAILHGRPELILFCGSRHLLPVIEGGVTVCEGSPSRAQYLPDQRRDSRPEWKYDPEREERFRTAYEQLQRHAAAENALNN